MRLSAWRTEVPLQRALIIFGVWILVAIAVWPLMVRAGLYVVRFSHSPRDPFLDFFQSDLLAVMNSMFRFRRWGWPAWALLRWCALLGAMAYLWSLQAPRAYGQRSATSVYLVRVLLIAPWIVLTDVLFVLGVVVFQPGVVPEPSTLFHLRDWKWDYWLMPVWLIRGAAPSMMLLTIFFRFVLELRWRIAVPLALVMVPLAINLSVFWSLLYMWMFLA